MILDILRISMVNVLLTLYIISTACTTQTRYLHMLILFNTQHFDLRYWPVDTVQSEKTKITNDVHVLLLHIDAPFLLLLHIDAAFSLQFGDIPPLFFRFLSSGTLMPCAMASRY